MTNVFKIARIPAQAISVLLHPLLMPTYMLALLLLVNPYLFGVNHIGDMNSRVLLLRVFASTYFIPAIAIVMLRLLGLIESLEIRDRRERTIPYIITGVFYLWLFRNLLGNAQIPTAYTIFMLGATIGLFLAFFINIFSKISAHAVGMGGLLGMVLITMFYFSYDTFSLQTAWFGMLHFNMVVVLLVVLLAAGMVGSSRLYLDAHEPSEVYGGFAVGFLSQLIALRIMF
ncbi:MAG: hypothetical protein KF852_13780 [Saprospiraceae bacterium]|nr:hypothetical protein [Saprospiraceae bacterium]